MKLNEREKAIELRKQGLTYLEIGQHLRVSRGSLSRWLRDIPYIPTQESLARRRLASLRNSQILHIRKIQRINQIMKKAKYEIPTIKSHELKLLGIMAYWCEGSKTQDNLVNFTNTDPKFIKFILRWLRKFCAVPEEKLRVHLRIHSDVNRAQAENYWSEITKIPISQFHNTTTKISGSNGKRKNKLKYGIATINVCNTNLHYKIKGWIAGLTKHIK